jgi:hypothetical protein
MSLKVEFGKKMLTASFETVPMILGISDKDTHF